MTHQHKPQRSRMRTGKEIIRPHQSSSNLQIGSYITRVCCCPCLSVCHPLRSGGPASSLACILGLSFPQGICFQAIRPANKRRMPHPSRCCEGWERIMSTRCRLSVVIVRAAGGLLSRPIYPTKPVLLSEAEGPASAFVVALAFLSVILRAAEDLLLPLLAFSVCHSRRESAFRPFARQTKDGCPILRAFAKGGKEPSRLDAAFLSSSFAQRRVRYVALSTQTNLSS